MTSRPRLHVTGDVAEFMAAASGFVAGNATTNTVMLTSVGRLAAGKPFSDAPPTFGWTSDGDQVVGAATCTPPYQVVVATEQVTAAAALAAGFPTATGVLGPVAVAEAFATATGRPWSHGRREVQYRLGELRPPAVSGSPREYVDSDLPTVSEWLRAFAAEAGTRQPADIEGAVAARIATGGAMWLWQDGGHVVSLAGLTPAVAGVARVGPVYTPTPRRGQGYASALTAAVCAAALQRGAGTVTLFADAANPTSNRIYARIGFVKIGEMVEIVFTDEVAGNRSSG